MSLSAATLAPDEYGMPVHNLTPAEKIDILHRTLDWLEAHPDKAITGTMATTASGRPCLPQHPDASCFCFVGRLSVEAGLSRSMDYRLAVSEWLEPLNVSRSTFQCLNDDHTDHGRRIKALRNYIEQLPGGGG